MRTLRSSRTGLWLGVLLVSLSATANAQTYPTCDRQPTADDVEGAKGAHKAAQRFYDKGQYQEAIRNWTDAYTFDCTAHPLLINIGNAYEKMGDRPKAVAAFETYLDRMGAKADPTIPDKVQNLKAQLERDQAPPPPPVTTGTATATTTPPPPPPDGGGTDQNTGAGPWPWVLVGGGSAGVVVGAILLGVGLSKVNKAEDDCAGRAECPASIADSGNTGRNIAGAGYAVGGIGILAVGGGLVWYFLDAGSADDAEPTTAWRVAPIVGPQLQGLTVGATF